MAGISSKALSFGNPDNKHEKFQGQPLDDDLGLNWYGFKWRNHDPQIGRFIEIDPLSEKYVYNSPYAFSENKVTGHVELEGLEAESSNNPRIRSLMNKTVQEKSQDAANTIKSAASAEVSIGVGIGVKAKVGNVGLEAGVSGPQAKVSTDLGGEVKGKWTFASAGGAVTTPIGDAKAGGTAGEVKFENGKVTIVPPGAGASVEAPTASAQIKDGNTSAKVEADVKGDVSFGAKLGIIGFVIKVNPINLLIGAAKALGAASTYEVESFKQNTNNPMINKTTNRGPGN